MWNFYNLIELNFDLIYKMPSRYSSKEKPFSLKKIILHPKILHHFRMYYCNFSSPLMSLTHINEIEAKKNGKISESGENPHIIVRLCTNISCLIVVCTYCKNKSICENVIYTQKVLLAWWKKICKVEKSEVECENNFSFSSQGKKWVSEGIFVVKFQIFLLDFFMFENKFICNLKASTLHRDCSYFSSLWGCYLR